MNDNARKWVQALRSGEYEQGSSVLTRCNTYTRHCCLGVACDLAAKEGVVTRLEGANYSAVLGDVISYDDETHVLPPAVQDWLGIVNETGEIVTDEEAGSVDLVGLNDGSGWSFDQIADFIEAHADQLFEETT